MAAAGGDAVLEVADEGPGHDDESAARGFRALLPRRLLPHPRAGGGGTGLGLSIVASLVYAHGGRVELATAPGEGATFTVRLPLAGAGDEPVDAGGEPEAAGIRPEAQ